MTDRFVVVHGHFYQPPRENPWTGIVPVERSAVPFHDWNERVTAECYRPNGWARVVDDHERVVSIENNYARMSFDIGPTLLSWLEDHHPDVYERILAADRTGGGAVAQAYNHVILPLATDRDVRLQVRWGLADFAERFGRRAEGMWLAETAVDERVLRILAEEGVEFTILAPTQATRIRPWDSAEWHDVDALDVTKPYRWVHPDDPDQGVTILFYDGPLSHDTAFGMGTLSSQALVRRMATSLGDRDGAVCIATDGESFGHHHHWADRTLAYALTVEAPAQGLQPTTAAAYIASRPPVAQVEVHTSSWSCAHGVERWRSDCGCHTGGAPGWNQAWRGPLRAALDLLRARVDAALAERGPVLFVDPDGALFAYVDVVLGRDPLEWAEQWVTGDVVEALTLMEAARNAQLMYTSCGWFFHDLAGLETVQILRYAAGAMDHLADLGIDAGRSEFMGTLGEAGSNRPDEGGGDQVWDRHVEPARVDAARVASHLALMDLLEQRRAPGAIGPYAVEVHRHARHERGGASLALLEVSLTHRATLRTSEHAVAALHLGALEVLGAVRPLAELDRSGALHLEQRFDRGERITTMLRLLAETYGPREFGVDSALPGEAEQIVAGAAATLTSRFAAAYERLYDDHRGTIAALRATGLVLPAELRTAAEMALGRRFEAEIAAHAETADPAALASAVAIADQARADGIDVATPAVVDALGRLVMMAVGRAVDGSSEDRVAAAVAALDLVGDLAVDIDLGPAQETVYASVHAGRTDLHSLAAALGLAP